ncbi:MAG: DUF2778 domain-containing protein [Elusimicrobiaceae bacterium]|nr:DUF2778 domain-containing protein [Elusimicrobiaceae bacterium]
MNKQNYHPQQDVFRLIDGKKESIQPYRFSDERERMSQPKKQAATGTHIESIMFDGKTLTTTAVNDQGEKTIQQLPAVSGLNPEKPFSYSPLRQRLPDRGPIPEGNYFVNPQKIQKPTLAQDVLGRVGKKINSVLETIPIKKRKFPTGRYPGGRTSWGNERTPIKNDPEVTKNTGRDNFFIHGGKEPGSGGCIDLTNHEKSFFDFLRKYRGKEQTAVPLTVKYPPELTGEDIIDNY